MKKYLIAALMAQAAFSVHADSVDVLKDFVREAKTGRAEFSQTVISPDGVKKKTSTGKFEFSRPNRFRFLYAKPLDQLIVADGQKVWIYDAPLNQVSSRKLSAALGATPAALLAGGALEDDFVLSSLPSKGGVTWVQAIPKGKDGGFQSVLVGFRGNALAALEIVDSFGQKSVLEFNNFVRNASLSADLFKFSPPAGADVMEQ